MPERPEPAAASDPFVPVRPTWNRGALAPAPAAESRSPRGETVSASVQPTQPASPWRFAVIGVVAALAVGIGIVLGSAILATRSASIGSGASYVPATAPLYVEVRIEPSEAQDAALREFLGHFPEIEGIDLSQPLYGQLTAKL